MPLHMYWGLGLLVPVCCTLIYGYVSRKALEALGYPNASSVWKHFSRCFFSVLLFTLWGMYNIPLPVVYILAYTDKVFRLLRKEESRAKELFLINFTHLTIMALHMILIGVFSLITHSQMYELLQQPFWRILTIGLVFTVNSVAAGMIPRWNIVLEVLRTQSESAEARPFMIFLWFCNAFLLLDSVLCVSKIAWGLLPLFLIGSTVLLEFYLIRFLRHLYAVLKKHYLEEEHYRLIEKLEQQDREAAVLRSKSVLDPMTNIFTRRYLVEKMESLKAAKEPFSFVYIDLDHLKQVNDRDGHHAGDLYLMRFVHEFGSLLRRDDIFSRVGGDEFVVLLPGCKKDAAANRLEDIRMYMAKKSDSCISFSYGVAYVSENAGDSTEQIFRRADQEMYLDKQARRR